MRRDSEIRETSSARYKPITACFLVQSFFSDVVNTTTLFSARPMDSSAAKAKLIEAAFE